MGWMEADCMRCDGTGLVSDAKFKDDLAVDMTNGIEITDDAVSIVPCGTPEAYQVDKKAAFEERLAKKGK